MTTSQLLGGPTQQQQVNGGSRLNNGTGAAAQRPPLSGAGRRQLESAVSNQAPSADGGESQPAAGGRKPPRNKRIISRMLSISAIHTSVAGSGSSGAGGQLAPESSSGQLSGSQQQLNASHEAAELQQNSNNNGAQFGSAANRTTTGGDLGGDHQAPDKIDSSFTRSRSSSGSSGVQLPAANSSSDHQSSASSNRESIQCLCLIHWPLAAGLLPASSDLGSESPLASTGSQQQQQLALYLGTSHGRVLLVGLEMPDSEDNRILQLQSVSAEPIPRAAIKLAGSILCLATFSAELSGAPPVGSSQHQQPLTSQSSSLESEGLGPAGGPALSASAGGGTLRGQDSVASASGPNSSSSSALFLALVSEKQAKIYQIPAPIGQQSGGGHKSDHHAPSAAKGAAAQSPLLAESPMAKFLVTKSNCVAKTQLSESSFACSSGLIHMRSPDECCLASYLATGQLLVHSLPKLRPLWESDFVACSSPRLGRSVRFSRQGHALYQPSKAEVAKFSLSAHYKALLNEMTGSLYVPRDMPEQPRPNFFKSLFSVATSGSVASRQSDRDELFGETSKASRGVAKHIGGGPSGGLDKLKGAVAGSLGHEMRMAREGLDERGEKLSEIEDKTLAMLNQSENYAQTAHQLAQKFKDKKWYQF